MEEEPKPETAFSKRLIEFFEEQKFTDCTFTIQGENLKAHKIILACASPVFEGMFYGQMASDTIFLDDVSLEDFQQVLVHIYSNNIDIHSVENAWNLYYIAQKYLLEDLIKICYEYISDNKFLSSLILSYEYAELYNEKQLKDACLFDMSCSINATFFSGYHMKPSTLTALLKLKFGYLMNLDLVIRIIEWAVKELELNGNQCPDQDDILHLLKSTDILRFIYKSWLETSKCSYCRHLLNTCLCVSEVVRKVVQRLSAKDLVWEEHPDMNDHPWRYPPGTHTRAVYKIARRLDLSKKEEFVSRIEVDKSCVVFGLLLCTETKPNDSLTDEYEGSISVRFCLGETNRNVAKPTKITTMLAYNSDIYVPLRFPIVLSTEHYYNIKIGYENHSSNKKSILVCSYMSGNVNDRFKSYNARMSFYDDGSVIEGVGYYPV